MRVRLQSRRGASWQRRRKGNERSGKQTKSDREKERQTETDRHRETGFGERLDRVEVWCRRFSDHLLPSVVPSFPTSIVRATFRNCSASSGFDPASIANADGAAALAPPFFFFFFLGILPRSIKKTPKKPLSGCQRIMRGPGQYPILPGARPGYGLGSAGRGTQRTNSFRREPTVPAVWLKTSRCEPEPASP